MDGGNYSIFNFKRLNKFTIKLSIRFIGENKLEKQARFDIINVFGIFDKNFVPQQHKNEGKNVDTHNKLHFRCDV